MILDSFKKIGSDIPSRKSREFGVLIGLYCIGNPSKQIKRKECDGCPKDCIGVTIRK
jgi:hypothetical protein